MRHVNRAVVTAFLLCSCGGGSSSSSGSRAVPPAAQTIASGGTTSASAHYQMVSVVGEPVIAATATSTHYRMQGGVVGAQGTLP